MAGTKEGGKKCAATNKERYGDDWYAKIGQKGGRNGHTGGFAANPELAKIAGRKGGLISSRAKDPQFTLEERRNEIKEMLKQEQELSFYEVS